jgi:alcohol oxidase
MRPCPEDLPEFGKEFEKIWQEYFEPAPDKPVTVNGVMAAYLPSSKGLCAF